MGLLTMLALAACSQSVGQPSSQDKLKVVATTTIVGDVVAQIGGELLVVDVLLPVGTDPHGFDPTPQDVAKIAEADVIFANGAGLEEFLDNLIESAGVEDKVIHVSEGIDFLMPEGDEHEHDDDGEEHGEDHGEDLEDEHEGDTHEDEHEGEEHVGEEHHHDGVDPHVWTDPSNVMTWVHNIEHVLSEIDPDNAETYQTNSEAYLAELEELDAWIREQVALIPEKKRKLVTDHGIFTYFSNRYSFEQVGTLIPGYSTVAEPTAQELAQIEDAIKDLDVRAVFVGNTVNPSLAERVAEDTGVQLIYVYTGSLSEAGGEADSYLAYMRYNTAAFVKTLK